MPELFASPYHPHSHCACPHTREDISRTDTALQVKQIGGRARSTLSKVMVALSDRTADDDPDELAKISKLAIELGVVLKPDSPGTLSLGSALHTRVYAATSMHVRARGRHGLLCARDNVAAAVGGGTRSRGVA